ncbi:MAG: triose-phosphate isomerase [Ruminococcaceae bacterium]|nr:triose-phosphate isomerase [Oscillospiraceae bacterium]
MRKILIAGNWKMNKTVSETVTLVEEITKKVTEPNCDVVICVPYTSISDAVKLTKGTPVKVGAQNMHFLDNGAYTGEISADMLLELGVTYVIIGHSERREYYNETDETVNKKVLKAIEKNLISIVCVGETLEQRENNETLGLVKGQVEKALKDVSIEDIKKVVFAYEPIWAIGTGKTATCEQANEVCKYIRECVKDLYNEEIANEIKILYGGSMNVKNADELLKEPDIDGGLIGGASLKSEDFSNIVDFC